MTWTQTSKRSWALDRNMGGVWETLYHGWCACVTVNGIVTRLPSSPDADAAKKLVEDYWEAAWAMQPKTSGDQESPTRSGS